MANQRKPEIGGKIAVLCGGTTSEREVSLKTGTAIHRALCKTGWEADLFDWPESDVALRIKQLLGYNVIFLGYHGGAGESGKVAAVLELAGIPYTGSGPAGSAIAMDKLFSKRLFDQAGIPTPRWLGWEEDLPPAPDDIADRCIWGFPIVVKPANEGSTVGITIAQNENELASGIEKARSYCERLLFEEYIPGRELTFAVIEGLDTPAVEIIPEEGFYDFEHKYTSGVSDYICPAEIPEDIAFELKNIAEKVFSLFRLRQYARADFRFDGRDVYCLEINSLPGMTSLSLVPMAAKAAGMGFDELVDKIARMAIAQE